MPPPLVRLLPVCCLFRYRFARVRHTPRLKLKHHTKSIITVCLLGTCGNDFPTGLAKVVLSSVIYYKILVRGKALIKGSVQVLHQHIHGGSWAYKRWKVPHYCENLSLDYLEGGKQISILRLKLKWKKKYRSNVWKTMWLQTFDRQTAGKWKI